MSGKSDTTVINRADANAIFDFLAGEGTYNVTLCKGFVLNRTRMWNMSLTLGVSYFANAIFDFLAGEGTYNVTLCIGFVLIRTKMWNMSLTLGVSYLPCMSRGDPSHFDTNVLHLLYMHVKVTTIHLLPASTKNIGDPKFLTRKTAQY